jgi:hypothetical protein
VAAAGTDVTFGRAGQQIVGNEQLLHALIHNASVR